MKLLSGGRSICMWNLWFWIQKCIYFGRPFRNWAHTEGSPLFIFMWNLWFWIQKHVEIVILNSGNVEFVILKSKWVSILEYHLWIRHIKKKSLWWRGKDRKLNFIGKRQHFYCLNCVYSRPPATNIVKFHDKQ